MEKDINPIELDFLLRYPAVPGLLSPVDFLSNLSWGGIKAGYRMSYCFILSTPVGGRIS